MSDEPAAQDPAPEDASSPDVDPAISEAVHSVANRFGAEGLEQLIELARAELVAARQALDELG